MTRQRGVELPGDLGRDLSSDDVVTLARLKEIVRLAPIGVGIVDREGRAVLTNDALSAMLGYSPAEFAELPFEVFTHPEDIAPNLELFEELMTGRRDRFEMDKRFLHRDGHLVWGRLLVSVLREDDGAAASGEQRHLAIGLLQDITEEKRLRDELERLAFHDPLTDLANRRLLVDRISNHLDRGRRTGRFGGVLFADLDDFKVLNDSLGHHAGDHVLRTVASRITADVRPGDTVCRLGGDEFAVLLEEVTDLEEALAISARLSERVARPIEVAGRTIVPRMSVGVVLLSGDHDADRALHEADLAMYRAKASGADVTGYSPELLDPCRHELERPSTA